MLPKNGRPEGEIHGRGFYRDLQEKDVNGKPVFYVTHEDLKLIAYESNDVSGGSEGPVFGPSQNKTIKKEFSLAGYRVNGFMFLSYRITKEEGGINLPSGVGSYALRQAHDMYFGEITMRDSDNDTALACPYVLSTSPPDQELSDTDALKRWPMLACGRRTLDLSSKGSAGAGPLDACSSS